ncbi:MAG: sulfatase-like hydrolase/transferase [Pseudomonadota bacterium]|nr:sulfatase-like hydrolase/transferase [Pseudomonadota bacterium]
MATSKQNIVFIFADQQRNDVAGYAGDRVAITPHLDRIAGHGISFTNCVTSSPVCMTARTSIMTGLQIHQHGVWTVSNPELRHGQSHVRNIRDAGYRTGIVGKNHLWPHEGGDAREHAHELLEWGWDTALEVTGPSETLKTDSEYTDYLIQQGLLSTFRDYLDHYHGERVDGRHRPAPWELGACDLPPEATLDMFVANEGAKWIREHRGDKPFYLQVNFGGPHDPWDAPQSYRDQYQVDDMSLSITEPPTGPLPKQVQQLLQYAPVKLDTMTDDENRALRLGYYSKLTLIDDCVGKVLEALEQTGQLSNTWVVFSADHGELLGDHGLLAKKAFYDGSVQVPCLLMPPGGTAPGERAALNCHLDIVATMLEIAGAAVMPDSDGRSLLSFINSTSVADQHHKGVLSQIGIPPQAYSMVMTERYKLSVDTLTRSTLELYDRKNDPMELHNRVDDPAYASIAVDIIESTLDPMLETLDTSSWT